MTTRTPFLEVRALSHRFGDRAVLEDVTFQIGEGEFVGLLGPNGSGKSTAFQLLTGVLRLQRGELRLQGQPIRAGDRKLKTVSGVVFQSNSLDARLSARENLTLAARLYGLRGKAARSRIDELLEWMDLRTRSDEPISRWSGGMRRRLEIVRALLHRPKLLILDEPTTGIDEYSFQRVWEMLHSLRKQTELSLLVITHRAEEAEHCDRLLLIDRGRVIANDTPEKLKEAVAGDVIWIEGERPEELLLLLRERVGIVGSLAEGKIVVTCERGHEWIPRLVEALPARRITSVAMRRPTLGDVFVKLTGQSLEKEPEAAA